MRLNLYLNDYETEKIFSYLRWVFLVVAVLLFYVPPFSSNLGYDQASFPILLSIGFIYMATTQIALQFMEHQHRYFSIITKAGILFDYLAFMWLLFLTGGVASPLFPISFLVIMHATIYWRTKGALFSTLAISIGLLILYLSFDSFHFQETFMFLINICFTWIVGLFGSLIVIRERAHMKEKKVYHELVVTDYLTGLYNHRHFQEQIRKLSNQSSIFYLVLGDIDFFKSINDQYGHLVGDDVLKSLGEIFHQHSVQYDAQAFRYGGEEFAFILPELPNDRLKCFFQEMYEKLNQVKFTDENWTITMSFGIAKSDQVDTVDQLITLSDQYLYFAKNNGKNHVHDSNGCLYRNGLSKGLKLIKPS